MKRIWIGTLLALVLMGGLACKEDGDSDSSTAGTAGAAGTSGAGGQGGDSATAGMSAGAAGQDGEPSNPCMGMCEIVDELDCPGDRGVQCLTQCNALWTGQLCPTEFRALATCFAQQPRAAWACDAVTMEAAPTGCEQESTALQACIDA